MTEGDHRHRRPSRLRVALPAVAAAAAITATAVIIWAGVLWAAQNSPHLAAFVALGSTLTFMTVVLVVAYLTADRRGRQRPPPTP